MDVELKLYALMESGLGSANEVEQNKRFNVPDHVALACGWDKNGRE